MRRTPNRRRSSAVRPRRLRRASALPVSLLALTWSAEHFVFAFANTARARGAGPLSIGVTIVGFGSPAAALLIAGCAACQGVTGLAIGIARSSG